PEPALRRFELALLAAMGYGVDFLHCAGTGEPIDPQMTYRYREQKGFIASVRRDNLTFLGNELIAISERRFLTKEQLQAAKRFTRIALKPYLGGKPLKSRELFIQMRIPRTRSMEK
ncbi:DNA repair protein RecO C-terminal domain-containing protein, partial [Vibrio vulnificus]